MKKEDIEFFDLTVSQKSSKKTKKIKKEIDYTETNITLKRVIIFVVGLLIVLATLFAVSKYTKYLNPIKNMIVNKTDKNSSNNDSIVILKTISYDLGNLINEDINYYIEKKPEGLELSIDLTSIPVDEKGNTNSIGEYSYYVNSKEKKYTGKIFVIDKEPPFVQTKIVYVAAGSKEIKPELFFREIRDNSQKYVAQITNLNNIDLNTPKEYLVKISVSDDSGNITLVEQKMFVLGPEYANLTPLQDTNVSYNDKNDSLWNQVITEKFLPATTITSAIYKNAINRINAYDWFSILNRNYYGAKINSNDIMILYNQYDLIVGLTMRVNLTFQGETKNHYFSY